MRNDSRPIFKDSPASPIGGDEPPIDSEKPDSRDTVAHGRESHLVHQETEKDQPKGPRDSVTPSSNAAPNAKI
jgi:hypothetical protein